MPENMTDYENDIFCRCLRMTLEKGYTLEASFKNACEAVTETRTQQKART